jgi:hypothetical protein
LKKWPKNGKLSRFSGCPLDQAKFFGFAREEVARKPDLIEPNYVYHFSSFIEPYLTHIVTAQMLFDCWTMLKIDMFVYQLMGDIFLLVSGGGPKKKIPRLI